MKARLAIDFGGGSGRVIAGWRGADGSMVTDEVHRFANRPVTMGGYTYWDFPALFADMKEGIRRAVAKGYRVQSIGIDTWGVDFGLIDHNGCLLGNPICYRDSHTDGMVDEFFATRDIDAHYGRQGIQIMGINTLYRLLSMQRAGDPRLAVAQSLLMMPDLFSYYLTGVAVCEYTEASTTELLDARTRSWDWTLIDSLGLPRRIFPPIVMPGESRGTVLDSVADELGLPHGVPVIAVGSHDTASAVAAAPAAPEGKQYAFLSSGTWSLLGVALEEPILTARARLCGCSNEGGVGGKILFLQNITGLWILQSLVRQWQQAGQCADYGELVAMAEASAYGGTIDVDDAAFTAPGSMQAAIDGWLRQHGQPLPQGQGDYVRCVCASLARRYARAVEHFNSLLPRPIDGISIIGGGSRNALLTRLTALCCGLPVTAGPAEATAIGNLMVQDPF